MSNNIDFLTFLQSVILSFPHVGYDDEGSALIDIKLITKKESSFKYTYKAKSVKIDDYILDRNTLLPIQIKRKIYEDFFNSK